MLVELHEAQTDIPQIHEGAIAIRRTFSLTSELLDSKVLTRYRPNRTFENAVDWQAYTSVVSQWAIEVASAVLQVWSELQWPHGKGTFGSFMDRTLFGLFDRRVHWLTKAHAPHQTKLRDLTLLKEAGYSFFLVIKNFLVNDMTWIRKQLHGKLFKPLHRGMTKSMQTSPPSMYHLNEYR